MGHWRFSAHPRGGAIEKIVGSIAGQAFVCCWSNAGFAGGIASLTNIGGSKVVSIEAGGTMVIGLFASLAAEVASV